MIVTCLYILINITEYSDFIWPSKSQKGWKGEHQKRLGLNGKWAKRKFSGNFMSGADHNVKTPTQQSVYRPEDKLFFVLKKQCDISGNE